MHSYYGMRRVTTMRLFRVSCRTTRLTFCLSELAICSVSALTNASASGISGRVTMEQQFMFSISLCLKVFLPDAKHEKETHQTTVSRQSHDHENQGKE